MELVVEIYAAVQRFPKTEGFGLTSQIKRAVVSIPSNIAEGAGRQTDKEFSKFPHVAQGSASEVDTQIEIVHRLGYLDDDQKRYFDRCFDDIGKK